MVNFNGLKVFTDLDDAIQCARIQQKPIFLLFTGHGCVGDTSYEETLFVQNKCRDIIAEHFIPVMLYVDSKIELPDQYRKEVELLNRKVYLTKLGKKNQFIQYSKFNSNVQPLVVILTANGTPFLDLDYIEYQSDHAVGLSNLYCYG